MIASSRRSDSQSRFETVLDRAALGAVLVLPLAIVHARSVADTLIVLVAAQFVVRRAVARDWRWAVTGWMRWGLAWWAWLIVCSLPGIGLGGTRSLLQALVDGRFLLFAAALEQSVLRPPAARRWIARSTAATLAWLAAHDAAQFLTGRTLFGFPRSADGTLSDPIGKPRVGAEAARLLFPVLLPVLRERRAWTLVLGVGALAWMVFIGQRMPLLLTLLGLAVTALLLPALRRPALIAACLIPPLVAGTALLRPTAFDRLYTRFADQMEHFQTSDYGRVFDRAIAIAQQHPWHGRGAEGYRSGCADPRYFRSWTLSLPPLPGEAVPGCSLHPHNHYLEALTDAGIPGLILFAGLIWAWLSQLGQGLWRDPDPTRVGLFVAALIDQWPLASTSGLTAIVPEALFFLLLGWGLAEARADDDVIANRLADRTVAARSLPHPGDETRA